MSKRDNWRREPHSYSILLFSPNVTTGGQDHIATSGPKFQFIAAIFPFKFSNKGGITFPVKHPKDVRLRRTADFEILCVKPT